MTDTVMEIDGRSDKTTELNPHRVEFVSRLSEYRFSIVYRRVFPGVIWSFCRALGKAPPSHFTFCTPDDGPDCPQGGP